jgi:tRNA-modifying protein YgfZ
MQRSTFARLTDRALIRVAGTDWRSFLQGLLTQDVETMRPGDIRYGALLTPQGRLLYDMFVVAGPDHAWLDIAASVRDALIARLKMYRLRAKVELEPVSGEVVALWGDEGAPDPRWKRDPRLPALGWRGVDLAPPAGCAEVDAAEYRLRRTRLGVADVAEDGLSDKLYALEANLDLLGGVDFRKGCFVGQETTSRMKRRTVVRSRLLPLEIEGAPPAPGAEVDTAAGMRAGEVRSLAGGAALALLRLDRIGSGELSVEGRPAVAHIPDWIGEAVAQATAPPVN